MNPNATVKERNAIKWLLARGYRPVLGGLRDLRNFELTNKDSGETERFDINQVVADYDQDRKDEARMRAAERRQNATQV